MRYDGSTPQSSRLQRATNAAVLTALAVGGLYAGRAVLIPLVIAVLLSFALTPLVSRLRAHRVPRPLAVGLVVTFLVIGVTALGVAMARQITDLGNDLPRYEATLREKLKSLRTGLAQSSLVDRATETLGRLNRELEQQSGGQAPAAKAGDVGARPIPVEVHAPPERPLDTYQRIIRALLEPLTSTGIVLLLLVFILMQRDDIRDRVIRIAGVGDIETTTTALNDAAERLSKLLLAQSILNAIYGCFIAICLWVIGVPSAVVWGIVAALMRFVPYIGTFLSAIFPVLLAAAVDPGWSMVVWTLFLYVVVEPVVGQIIEPTVQGHTTGLSPLAVVLSAILWTALWGPMGLLLATPLTMCLVVLGRHIEGFAFLDVILGDQPALTAPEAFYHRLLAGAEAEAADEAERALSSSSLVDYVDTIALPGLRLAAADRKRGVLEDERLGLLLESTQGLRDELADARPVPERKKSAETGEDLSPLAAPASAAADTMPDLPVLEAAALRRDWQKVEGPVLCLGVATELDAAGGALLALAIERHGVPATWESTSRLSDLGRLDLAATKLIWLVSLEAHQAAARRRYVVRRLRRLAPHVDIAVAVLDDSAPQPEADVDGVVATATSARAVVAATLEAAAGAGEKDPANDEKSHATTDAGAGSGPPLAQAAPAE